MSLNRTLSAEFDACSVLAYASEKLGYRETGIPIFATWRDDVGCGEVTVEGRNELCCELGKVTSYDGPEFACLITEFEHGFNLRNN